MATTELPRYSPRERAVEREGDDYRVTTAVQAVLAPLSSLRLTVAMLALSLPLILAGTLAQVDVDVWRVVHDYFRTWIAWIDVQVFLPRSLDWWGKFVFPYPGGKLIGSILAINLLAAHGVRFKIASSGSRLVGGIALIGVGALITYAVIASGSNTAIESQLSVEFTNGLWHALRASLGGAALALAYVLALTRRRAKESAAGWTWWFGAVAAAIMLGLAVYLFMNPEARLDASGLAHLVAALEGDRGEPGVGAGVLGRVRQARRRGAAAWRHRTAHAQRVVDGGAGRRGPDADCRGADRVGG